MSTEHNMHVQHIVILVNRNTFDFTSKLMFINRVCFEIYNTQLKLLPQDNHDNERKCR